MGRVSLLPVKFSAAQQKDGAFLPAHHVIPLVDQNGQITIALNPLRVAVADNRLTRGANSKRLFQFLAATPCPPRHLRRKSFDMLSLSLQKAARDKQGEVGVDDAGLFETRIQETL